MLKRSLLLISLFFCGISAGDDHDSSSGFAFLPESHFHGELRTFFLQKDEFFKNRYVFEVDVFVKFALFSVNNRFFQNWEYCQWSGMGRQDEIIIFDPRDVGYAVLASGEYRFSNLYLELGIDHPCFHEIDRKETPTVYWNKVFAGAASPRIGHDKSLSDNPWKRLQWQARWGFFLRSRGSAANTVLMSVEPGYLHEFTFDSRYDIFQWRNAVLSFDSYTLFGQMEKGVYWAQRLGCALRTAHGPLNGSIFARYTLDRVFWELSRDRLLEIGIRLEK